MSSMLSEHLDYVADTRRMALYRQAVSIALKGGEHVVDAGCGTAVLGLLCLQAGAGKVTAIETADIIEAASESLTRAGWGDKVDFVRGLTSHVSLQTPADLVICDHVGYFGFDYGLIEIMSDARKRFLREGGRLLPRRLRLFVAGVCSPERHQKALAWTAPDIPAEFGWLNKMSANEKQAVQLRKEEVVTPPFLLAEIDLELDQPSFFSWPYHLAAFADTNLHGLAGWFECELTEDVWMTNSPLSNDSIHRPQAFFPFSAALAVKAGEPVSGSVMARPSEHLIAWVARHPSGQERKGSTWEGDLLPKSRLERCKPKHVPTLNWRARATSVVLSYCDGQRSVEQIREKIYAEHPSLLPSREALRAFIDEVLAWNAD